MKMKMVVVVVVERGEGDEKGERTKRRVEKRGDDSSTVANTLKIAISEAQIDADDRIAAKFVNGLGTPAASQGRCQCVRLTEDDR